MEFLLDTNIISYIFDGRSPGVVRRLSDIDASDHVYCSAVTEGELLFGVANAPAAKRDQLLAEIVSFLSDLAGVASVDRAVARAYSMIRYDLKTRGALVPDNDLWIAATAVAGGYTLVSHDESFRRITNLKLEDWMADA